MTVAPGPQRLAGSRGSTGGERCGTEHGPEAVGWGTVRMDVHR